MTYVVQRQPKRKPGHRPERLLYRSGITRDELTRLIEEVGYAPVVAALQGLGIQVEPALTPTE